VLRWRAAVTAARPEEVPDDCEDLAGLMHMTALALGQAEARLWACACLRQLPLLEGGVGPALLADPRRRRVVAAVELFACGLLDAEHLRAVRATELDRGPGARRVEVGPAASSSGRWPSRTSVGRCGSCSAPPASSWAPTAAGSGAAPR
jgi:hypothetical protein